jgi:hypothetical protein
MFVLTCPVGNSTRTICRLNPGAQISRVASWLNPKMFLVVANVAVGDNMSVNEQGHVVVQPYVFWLLLSFWRQW